jgi:hypothetical protein
MEPSHYLYGTVTNNRKQTTTNKQQITNNKQITRKHHFCRANYCHRLKWDRPMIATRLPVLGTIAVMLLSCGVAVAGPNEPSASYFMPGCRDAASMITFSVRESEEEVAHMNFCAGIVVGLSFMGHPYGICVPAGTTSQQIASIVVQYIDGQPDRIREDFNHFAVEALRANWPCSIEAHADDPLAVVLH